VVVIYAGTQGYLDRLPVKDVGRFERGLLSFLRNSHGALLNEIRDNDQKIAGDIEKKIRDVLDSFGKTFA